MRLLLWGNRADYQLFRWVVQMKKLTGQIELIGIISEEGTDITNNEIPWYQKIRLPRLNFDYLMALNDGNYKAVRAEAARFGIAEEKVISSAVLNLYGFDFTQYQEIQKRKITILSNNCWGGLTYHALRKEFLSPTINMFEDEMDYIKLLKDLQWYLLQPLILEKKVYNENLRIYYPVFLLGDIRLYMNHYSNFKVAQEKWYERSSRMNWEDLFVMMYTQNKEILEQFDQLPYEHKVCFVPFQSNLQSAYYVKCFKDPVWQRREFWEVVNWMADGQSESYKLLELLKS